jgi:hypothetical protein
MPGSIQPASGGTVGPRGTLQQTKLVFKGICERVEKIEGMTVLYCTV